jgi:hypothetical protein
LTLAEAYSHIMTGRRANAMVVIPLIAIRLAGAAKL